MPLGLTMAEFGGAWWAWIRRVFPLAVFLLWGCAAAVETSPAMASSPALHWAAQSELFPPALSFQLPASNGYTLSVIGQPPLGGHRASLLITLSAKGRSAVYSAPGTVTETSMQADLGNLGEISVNFQRSIQGMTIPCEGRTIRVDSGSFVGMIDFHGEEGFTSVEAATVPGSVEYVRGSGCDLGQELVGHSVGEVVLSVRKPGLGSRMSVSRQPAGGTALLSAWVLEYSKGISIERATSLRIPGSDFTYDRRLRSATVRPPAPFAGSARFELAKKVGHRWSGDLTVDLPGNLDVPLTGRSLRATLARIR